MREAEQLETLRIKQPPEGSRVALHQIEHFRDKTSGEEKGLQNGEEYNYSVVNKSQNHMTLIDDTKEKTSKTINSETSDKNNGELPTSSTDIESEPDYENIDDYLYTEQDITEGLRTTDIGADPLTASNSLTMTVIPLLTRVSTRIMTSLILRSYNNCGGFSLDLCPFENISHTWRPRHC